MIDYKVIIDGLKKNDKQAQALMYKWLAPKLLGLCLRYFKNRSEAEDVMQDSLVKVFMKIDLYKFDGNFEAWAKRIAVNTALNHIKINKRLEFDRNLKIVENIEFKADEVSIVDEKDILACLDNLALGYRTIINLFLIENFSHKEIAEKLEISEGTSRSQLARAKQALAKLLKEKIKNKETKYA